jgi:hypothetical protein
MLRMSCSADYTFVFWSGNADYYLVRKICMSLCAPKKMRENILLEALTIVGDANVGSTD